ncbi:MAG: EAL domain-containing protein [Butyrivibrio sp.]|nr:EAL domain-containing protein [Butyrivibrio sp.]
MDVITNPKNYNIAFTIASLVLLIVTLVIHLAEDSLYNRQKQLFGALIVDALILNCMGLVHNLWRYSDFVRGFISYPENCAIVIIEKICAYLIAYFSMVYVMSIFRLEADTLFKKVVLIAPTAYVIGVFVSGFITDFFFYFNLDGELKYRYPQGTSVNIGVYLYFIFASYLYFKYCRSLSTEKFVALIFYYMLLLAGIPIRIITKSSSIFEFSASLALILCVYTFQNPSEFSDRMSGAGTKNALSFAVSNNLLQKKRFTVFGIRIERLEVMLGSESLETSSDLLIQITSYLKRLGTEGSVFYPDEGIFMMIFEDTDPDDPVIEKTSDLIKRRFRDSFTLGDKEIRLFESPFAIGLPGEADSLDKFNEIIVAVRKVLNRHNRNVLRVSDLNLKHVEHDKKIDSIVKHAMDDGLLEVYYQPIYNTKTGKYTSCEALLRLKDPQLGFISPAVFMPLAERNGKVLEIDNYVLCSVCEMLAHSEAVALGIDYVEVNLSVVDCIQANMADNVMKVLKRYEIAEHQINFEITETYERGINSVMNENIRKLAEQGIRFSMDDFGTGYSNIARISYLPVDMFKLDKSIVQAAFESRKAYMVMHNLIKIIKSIGKKIVAEGVETQEQAEQIIRLGCDSIQGFYYARPMPRRQFIEFLRQHNAKDSAS